MDYFYSVRYSQDVKDFLVKLHQEGRSLKSLAEGFGPSNDSMDIWVKQATPIMIKGQSDFKRRQATREAPRYFGGRKRNFITHSLTGIERPSY